MDALGLFFVVGVGGAVYQRYVAQTDRLWGRHASQEETLLLGSLFVLGVGAYLTEGVCFPTGTDETSHTPI